METTLNNKFFDFEKAKVQTLSLDQLARTHKENDIYGKPLRGIYHYDLLNQIIGMCNAQNYDVEVYDLFAAQYSGCRPLAAGRGPIRRAGRRSAYPPSGIRQHSHHEFR